MEEYINDLEQNTNKLLETVKDYPAEKLTAKKGTEWSVMEILEHIYLTDKVIHGIVSRPSETESSTKEIVGRNKLESILANQLNTKLQAPDLLHPKGHFQSLPDFASAFTTLRNTIKNDLVTKNIKVDNRIHNHFLLGEMTITDWLNFILFHTERHIKQIEEKQ